MSLFSLIKKKEDCNVGVKSIGIKTPLIREGDDIVSIVIDSVLKTNIKLNNKDIIGITESVIARSTGNFVTVDDIAEDVKSKFGEDATVCLINPIYSRNRFAMILKGIARGVKKLYIAMPSKDEVGNVLRDHPFTGINYDDYYREIVEGEGTECVVYTDTDFDIEGDNIIYCGLHDYKEMKESGKIASEHFFTLADICNETCEYGVLGSNKATEEKLKLFPNTQTANNICLKIKEEIKNKTGKDVIVVVYGDGCFKSPGSVSIWEFADPITMPAYTDPEIIESTPNELKLKAIIDESAGDAEVRKKLYGKQKDLKGNMASQGTTPRMYRDLIASLMDLTSGSGDKGTPVVLIQNYFSSFVS